MNRGSIFHLVNEGDIMANSNRIIDLSGSEEFDLAYWDWLMNIGKKNEHE